MADMQSSYDEAGNLTTTTHAGPRAVIPNDMDEFFRKIAERSLENTVKPAPAPIPAPGPLGGGRGPLGRDALPVPTSRPVDTLARQRAEQDERERMQYAKKLREFDLRGPAKKNLWGGPQVTGGVIEDPDSIPYSMRGAVSLGPSSSLERQLRGDAPAQARPVDDGTRADWFGTGTTSLRDQQAILRENAKQREEQAAQLAGGRSGGRRY